MYEQQRVAILHVVLPLQKRHCRNVIDHMLESKTAEIFASFIVHELTHVHQYCREHHSTGNPCNLALQNERDA